MAGMLNVSTYNDEIRSAHQQVLQGAQAWYAISPESTMFVC